MKNSFPASSAGGIDVSNSVRVLEMLEMRLFKGKQLTKPSQRTQTLDRLLAPTLVLWRGRMGQRMFSLLGLNVILKKPCRPSLLRYTVIAFLPDLSFRMVVSAFVPKIVTHHWKQGLPSPSFIKLWLSQIKYTQMMSVAIQKATYQSQTTLKLKFALTSTVSLPRANSSHSSLDTEDMELCFF